METTARFFSPPPRSYFIFGPRGTGKSTWLRTSVPSALWFDLLDPVTFQVLQAHPERLCERVRGRPEVRTIVIDEVQKIPSLLPVVHLLLEEDPNRCFVLTGSSSRKLKRAGVDLLAGRAVRREMHPFMAAELGHRFRLESALNVGLLPLVVSAPNQEEVLRSYVSLYLREEVQFEGIVRNLGNFARFLEAMSYSHAAMLNVSAVASDCGTGRKSVEGYVEILEDLLLGFRVPVFTRRARRATTAHPKFYFFDAGVFRSLRPTGPLDRPQEVDGAALEGLVAQHLRAWSATSGDRAGLSFWRTRGGSEVDFVVYGPSDFVAIEVKNSQRIRPEDLRGLKAFVDEYPECTPLLLHRGPDRLRIGDVLCVPVDEFLAGMRPGCALPFTDARAEEAAPDGS